MNRRRFLKASLAATGAAAGMANAVASAAVKVGDCFIADSGEEDLLVFGEVLEGYTEAHLRHYRFCRCFSVACPEGELGDVHVSTVLAVVSRAFFEAMRQEGWQMEAGQRPRASCRIMEGGGRPPRDQGWACP